MNHEHEILDEGFLASLREACAGLSRGELDQRIPHGGGARAQDSIAALFNRMAKEVGELFARREEQHSSLAMIRNIVHHRARLVCRYEAAPPVFVDRGLVSQVVIHLIQNGLQALPPARSHADNRIEVAVLRAADGMVVLEVSDNGVGVPAENLGRIFDSFFTTRPVGQGSGLGLALCKRMVADLGGRIEGESAIEEGSTVRVLLPVAEGG